jgi:hypothetical protein
VPTQCGTQHADENRIHFSIGHRCQRRSQTHHSATALIKFPPRRTHLRSPKLLWADVHSRYRLTRPPAHRPSRPPRLGRGRI